MSFFARRQGLVHRLDDVGLGDGPEDAVAVVDAGLEIDRLGPGDDDAVVDALVAIAVEEDGLARLEQGLDQDLVGRAGAVGGEEGVAGAEGPRGQVLGLLDHALGVEQRVELGHRDAEVGLEDVGAEEAEELARGQAGLDRVAARVAGRVPGVAGLQGVLAQLVEEGGAVLGADDLGPDLLGDLVVVAVGLEEVAVGVAAGAEQGAVALGGEEEDVDLEAQGQDALEEVHTLDGRGRLAGQGQAPLGQDGVDAAVAPKLRLGVLPGGDADGFEAAAPQLAHLVLELARAGGHQQHPVGGRAVRGTGAPLGGHVRESLWGGFRGTVPIPGRSLGAGG